MMIKYKVVSFFPKAFLQEYLTPSALSEYLQLHGFQEVKLKKEDNFFLFRFGNAADDYRQVSFSKREDRDEVELFHLLYEIEKVALFLERDMMSVLGDFGWGRCRTCQSVSDKRPESVYCENFDRYESLGFGCVQYEFKQS